MFNFTLHVKFQQSPSFDIPSDLTISTFHVMDEAFYLIKVIIVMIYQVILNNQILSFLFSDLKI